MEKQPSQAHPRKPREKYGVEKYARQSVMAFAPSDLDDLAGLKFLQLQESTSI